jgi:hypothetical protein
MHMLTLRFALSNTDIVTGRDASINDYTIEEKDRRIFPRAPSI